MKKQLFFALVAFVGFAWLPHTALALNLGDPCDKTDPTSCISTALTCSDAGVCVKYTGGGISCTYPKCTVDADCAVNGNGQTCQGGDVNNACSGTCGGGQSTTATPTTSAGSSGFVPLAPISGLTDSGTVNGSNGLANFLNNLYLYAIGIAGIIAVIEIVIGGLEYSVKDSIESHSNGRHRIQQAILGLVLVLSPYVVFSIINPAILNLSLNLPALNTAPTNTGSGGQTPTITQSFYKCNGTNCSGAEQLCSLDGGTSNQLVCTTSSSGGIVKSGVGDTESCPSGQIKQVACNGVKPNQQYTDTSTHTYTCQTNPSDNCQAAKQVCNTRTPANYTSTNSFQCTNSSGAVDPNGRSDSWYQLGTYTCVSGDTLVDICSYNEIPPVSGGA